MVEPGPWEVPNDGTPVTPRPAASVVLLRRGGKHAQRALEVLLVKRTEAAKFMPGVWVFPGGSVEDFDGEGVTGREAAARRELREEAGITLPEDEELVPFCRWITPEIIPRRFDAWFFLALAPAHMPPEPDGVEVTDARWFKPAEALAANASGELAIAFPTRTQLSWLAEHRTSDEAIAAHRGTDPEPIRPRVVGDGDQRNVLLPGQPGYDDVLPDTPGRPD
jgi:8-oxo-dGTP pyrophosphatase MutT (NUDIX family)